MHFGMSSSPYDDVPFPELSSLPFRKGDPPGAIWGFYESLKSPNDGQPDELGSLNLLTPKRILRASREEIQLGRVVSLNWPLQKPIPAGWQRLSFQHKIVKWPGRPVIDDEITMKFAFLFYLKQLSLFLHCPAHRVARNGIPSVIGDIIKQVRSNMTGAILDKSLIKFLCRTILQ